MSDRTADDGAADDEHDEDARLLDNPPNEDAIDEPTTDGEQEAAETVWMMKEWVSIGAVSILALLLLALALMQATGVVDLMSPIVETERGQWAVFGLLVLVGAALVLWARRGV